MAPIRENTVDDACIESKRRLLNITFPFNIGENLAVLFILHVLFK